MPFHSDKSPTLGPVFAKGQRSKEDFLLLWREVKGKNNHSVLVLPREVLEAVCNPEQRERPHFASSPRWLASSPCLLPGAALRTSASGWAGARVCECLWVCVSTSIYFVHPLARCALSYQKSLEEVIFWVWACSNIFPYHGKCFLWFILFWLTKGFIVTFYLQK